MSSESDNFDDIDTANTKRNACLDTIQQFDPISADTAYKLLRTDLKLNELLAKQNIYNYEASVSKAFTSRTISAFKSGRSDYALGYFLLKSLEYPIDSLERNAYQKAFTAVINDDVVSHEVSPVARNFAQELVTVFPGSFTRNFYNAICNDEIKPLDQLPNQNNAPLALMLYVLAQDSLLDFNPDYIPILLMTEVMSKDQEDPYNTESAKLIQAVDRWESNKCDTLQHILSQAAWYDAHNNHNIAGLYHMACDTTVESFLLINPYHIEDALGFDVLEYMNYATIFREKLNPPPTSLSETALQQTLLSALYLSAYLHADAATRYSKASNIQSEHTDFVSLLKMIPGILRNLSEKADITAADVPLRYLYETHRQTYIQEISDEINGRSRPYHPPMLPPYD